MDAKGRVIDSLLRASDLVVMVDLVVERALIPMDLHCPLTMVI